MISNDPLIGRQLANFRIERVMGRGGMAQVYYGWDVVLHRPVAIKVIDARYRDNPAYARRFVQEARSVASWRHDNIIQVFYADDEDGLYYFVMEYVDGFNLGQLLSRYAAEGKRLPFAEVLRIGRAIADALDYAHRKGVIHRDVKPSNVMLAADERVVLTDFGLALAVEQGSFGEVFGSAHYTAPEQARRSSDAVSQSDLYSLGVILYEMLTSMVPFDDPSPTSVALQHMTLSPPTPRTVNPDLNEATEEVLLKALDKSPGARYPTGRELMDALESGLMAGGPAQAKSFPLPPTPASSQLPLGQPARQASLVERVARHVDANPTPPIFQTLERPPRQATLHPKNPIRPLMARGRLLILAAIAGVLGVVLMASQQGGVSQATTLEMEGVVAQTDAPTSVNAAPPIETAAPGPTITEESLLTNAATPALAPPTASDPPQVTILPTVLYPNGRPFVIYYDDNSLYVYNASGGRSAISPFAFERLDASDESLSRFDSWRWTRYYPSIEEESCVRVEIRSSPSYLRPAQCRNRYNSTVTAARNDDFVFWTAREDSSQFRVLWNDQEVARCEIGAGACEVYLP